MSPRRAAAEPSCTGADAPEPQSFWNATVPHGTQPVAVPYLIVFDGSAGSSWFAECLDRHPRVFVAGYESLEWHGHPAYIGWNATEWQPGWLQDIWHLPGAIRAGGGPAEESPAASAEGAWAQWVGRYMRNEKLDPELHRSPLTVKMPQPTQLSRAQAVGFKIRPGTITANHLSGTLRAALKAMGGRLLVVNRRNAVKQALSLYRRRVEGRGQFLNSGGPDSSASLVEPSEMLRLLKHREQQEASIACAVASLDVPTHYVWYEDMLADFPTAMRAALRHLGVETAISSREVESLKVAAPNQAEQEENLERGIVATAAAATSPPLSLTAAANTAASITASTATIGAAAMGSTDIAAAAAVAAPQPAAEHFVKVTPDSLCVAIANLPQLCRHFKGTPHEVHFEPYASHGCKCDDRPEGAPEVMAPVSSSSSSSSPERRVKAGGRKGGGGGGAGSSGGDGGGGSGGDGGGGSGGGSGDDGGSPWSHQGPSSSCVLIGTHHKTGTVLMGQVLRTAAHKLEALTGVPTPLLRAPTNFSSCAEHVASRRRAICLEEHVTMLEVGADVRSGKLPLVHLIRDPLEICVSGYQYHLTSAEPWVRQPRPELSGASYQQYFQQAAEADGVVTECVRALPEMKQMVKLYAATSGAHESHPDMRVRSVRLEALGANFSSEMYGVLGFVEAALGVDARLGVARKLLLATTKYDLATNDPRGDKASHVSDASAKQRLRAALLATPRLGPLLRAMQRLLEYDAGEVAGAPATAVELAPTIEVLDDVLKRFWAEGMVLK